MILGVQLGVRVSKNVNRRRALLNLPVLFAAVGILTLLKLSTNDLREFLEKSLKGANISNAGGGPPPG